MTNKIAPLERPTVDPTMIFELYRGSYGSDLLTVAVAHFDVFGRLAANPRTRAELAADLQLSERSTVVLTTALLAMDFLKLNVSGQLELTQMAAEHLVPGTAFDIGNYIGLAATSPSVLEMVERLRTGKPAGLSADGAAFIYRSGMKSAMEQSALAEHFTLALSGRAKNVAPYLADAISLDGCQTLLDLGGGTGIYSIGFLKANPNLRATVFDRPEVLKTAERFATEYSVSDRMELLPGDMFEDELPAADVILLSNILHDWDVPECQQLINRCAAALKPGGRLLIHDVLLNDDLSGPLPMALYSAALFTLTEGRAYSSAEYQGWMNNAGLHSSAAVATLVHCHVICGTKT